MEALLSLSSQLSALDSAQSFESVSAPAACIVDSVHFILPARRAWFGVALGVALQDGHNILVTSFHVHDQHAIMRHSEQGGQAELIPGVEGVDRWWNGGMRKGGGVSTQASSSPAISPHEPHRRRKTSPTLAIAVNMSRASCIPEQPPPAVR